MLYLLAVIFPPLALLAMGRPGAAALNFLAMLTCIGWPLAVLHAIMVVAQQAADERNAKLIRAIRPAVVRQTAGRNDGGNWLDDLQ